MTRNDEAYWMGFTWGRKLRKALSPRSATPFLQNHDAVLGPAYSDGYRDGWEIEPIQGEG